MTAIYPACKFQLFKIQRGVGNCNEILN